MPKAIRFHANGGPEVMRWEDLALGDPGPGEARVRHKACGLNMIDVYQRTGLYKVPLPALAGNEGAGLVEAVGAGVVHVKPGDRVAYAGGPPGSSCEVRNMPADRLCILPEGIDFDQGAAMMLKGMTVQYLIRRTYTVRPGDTVLFHAAAGGVGLIACQWLKALGAKVIELYASLKHDGRKLPTKVDRYLVELRDLEMLADLMASTFINDPLRRQRILEERSLNQRLRFLIRYLHDEIGNAAT